MARRGRSRSPPTRKSDARVSYLFDGFLPAGHYIVELPEQGGLTDLAGLSPIADGQLPGTLGQFDVPPPEAPRDPFDYGALLPDDASLGIRIEQTVPPGQSTSCRFVVTVPGLYTLTEGPMSEPSSIQIEGPGVDRSLDPTGTNDTQLAPGEYTLRFRNLVITCANFTLIASSGGEPDGDRPGQRRGARARTVVAADLVLGSGHPSAPFGAHAHGPVTITITITITIAFAP